MSGTRAHTTQRRGNYGVDAPSVPAALTLGGLILLSFSYFNLASSLYIGALLLGLWSAVLLLGAGCYLYATLRGKFAVWDEVLAGLDLRGDERLLDLGCGRGAVLLLAARLLPRGYAVGLDRWKASTRSGNRPTTTRQNAVLEGVGERVALQNGDLRRLPFTAGTFDLVVSSLALHTIADAKGRTAAITEAVRVLRPGGRLVIADFRATDEYAARLRDLGLEAVTRRKLDWRFWYGGPWAATWLVTATKD